MSVQDERESICVEEFGHGSQESRSLKHTLHASKQNKDSFINVLRFCLQIPLRDSLPASIRHTLLRSSGLSCTAYRVQECLLLTLFKEQNDQTKHFFLAHFYNKTRLNLVIVWLFVYDQ
eukprot:Protomagalhaensia_wolfi_Nauph_80__4171@NODE_4241_length_608_cov_24_239016_g3373_i0_p1_GENE_NODE_4241_length_608_cov_24_239016_g3373_i0NODE_4241_length_608_cov_24_239016_g3373_i0_p1_ORF_typecomplete_len119_score10_62_NODE_4241_length_608_cov_24_239016_g3373_i0165521